MSSYGDSPGSFPGKLSLADSRSILVGCGEWGFREMPMRRHFDIAASFGFTFLEFGIGGGKTGRLSESPDAKEVDQFVAWGKEFKIATPFCCIENDFTLSDPAAHRDMVSKVLMQMAAAKQCGATHVRLFAGFTPLKLMPPPLWQQLLDALHECQTVADKLGLVIAIETHGAISHGAGGVALHTPTVTTDSEALRRLCREMPAAMGFNYDPGNIKAAEGSSRHLHLDLLNARINYCHMKDWKKSGDGWVACAVGDDDLDYGKLIPRMQFDGVFLVEYEPLQDPEDGIRRSLEALRRAGLKVLMKAV